MAEEERPDDTPWRWIILAVAAFLAWNHFSTQEVRSSQADAQPAYSPAMKACLARIGYANLPEETLIQMCAEEIQGDLSSPDCEVQYDGRANPTVCE